MSCGKCGSGCTRYEIVRERETRKAVVSCPTCGWDEYGNVTSSKPRQGKGKIVKLPGAKRKEWIVPD